jgi:hypothetical protein
MPPLSCSSYFLVIEEHAEGLPDRVVGHPDAAHADAAHAAEGLSDRVVGHPDAGHADGATHDGDDSAVTIVADDAKYIVWVAFQNKTYMFYKPTFPFDVAEIRQQLQDRLFRGCHIDDHMITILKHQVRLPVDHVFLDSQTHVTCSIEREAHADSAIAAVGGTDDGDDSGDGGLRAKLKDECKHATDCIRLSI